MTLNGLKGVLEGANSTERMAVKELINHLMPYKFNFQIKKIRVCLAEL